MLIWAKGRAGNQEDLVISVKGQHIVKKYKNKSRNINIGVDNEGNPNNSNNKNMLAKGQEYY